MKKFNLAVLPLAVAGVLASSSALAGTEACLEIYKVADGLGPDALSTIYTPAACDPTRTAAAATELQAIDESKIAYELTGDLDVEFEEINDADEDLHVVYIPTTDIPSGTLITFTLSGATFKGNSDIIHLVQDSDGAGANTDFVPVASSDGDVDGESVITFLTKAGVTITAGTRLAFSRISIGTDSDEVDPVGINISNTGCTDPTSTGSVTLTATQAKTDGGTGFVIAGGASSSTMIADISAQFRTFYNSTSTAAEVNAESADNNNGSVVARTEFVYDATSTRSDKLIHKSSQVITQAGFVDFVNELDKAIEIDGDDHLETKFITSADASDVVEAGIYNSITVGAATAQVILDTQIEVEDGTDFGTIAQDSGSATTYETEALDLFTPATAGDAETAPDTGAGEALEGLTTWNNTWYVLENTESTSPLSTAMNFNYTHTPEYTLNFDDSGELDHCTKTIELAKVGVNGAVLKVPYTFDTSNNFVRITNEHTEAAEITLDIFDESGNQMTSVSAGMVGEHASVVLKADALIDLAIADGYAPEGERHTMTFTVTAPKDLVHGVSVQAIPGSVDRVMPVLDQNIWTQ